MAVRGINELNEKRDAVQDRLGIQQTDAERARESDAEIVLQVNGKVRGRMMVAHGTAEGELKAAALEHEKVAPYVLGKTIVKVIVVVDRLVNVVVK